MTSKPRRSHNHKKNHASNFNIPTREQIISKLNDSSYSSKSHFFKQLGVSDIEKKQALYRRLQAMATDGQILFNKQGKMILKKGMLVVKAKVHYKKTYDLEYVFLDRKVGLDLKNTRFYTSLRYSKALMNNDTVLLRLVPEARKGWMKVILLETIEHDLKFISGSVDIDRLGHYWMITNQKIHKDKIALNTADFTEDLYQGAYVKTKIVQYPNLHQKMRAEVLEIIGDHHQAHLERTMAIDLFQLSDRFSQQVYDELAEIDRAIDFSGRQDWTKLDLITIDGADAKDYDDAVCVVKKQSGWTLYVAIADVSHYVKANGPLDKEAQKRATSVYLPGSVIPMLPELLSNDLCSLLPNKNRYAMGLRIELDDDLQVQSASFSKVVIHSKARLTYDFVAKLMEDGASDGYRFLQPAFMLYEKLLDARFARGALEIELPATQLIFGQDKKIAKILQHHRTAAHRMIEEFMLLANDVTADFLIKHKLKGAFRNHLKPDQNKWQDIVPVLNHLGLDLHTETKITSKLYQHVLKKLSQYPNGQFWIPMVLSTMQQAVYESQNEGHFGLAYPAYCHFTSPIRRYPDLLVHRALSSYLQQTNADISQSRLQVCLNHCSKQERKADEASKFAQNWLKCLYMEDKIGEVFRGRIASVKSFGFFVTLDDFFIDGMVHVSKLKDGYYHYDSTTATLISSDTQKSFAVGQVVSVRLIATEPLEGMIDFELV